LFQPTDAHSDTKSVSLSIQGPKLTNFGSPTIYTITYHNRGVVALTTSSLSVRFPTGFLVTKSSKPTKKNSKNEWDLGRIDPGEQGAVSITGILYGENRENRSWRAFLTYQGEALNSEVQETASFETTLINNPYTTLINGPTTIAPGMEAAYTFTVTNSSTTQSTDLELAPTWPEYFTVTSSSPALSKTLRWRIPKETTSSSLTFTLYGRFSQNSEKKAAIKNSLVVLLPEINQNFVAHTTSFTTEQAAGVTQGLALAINGSGAETIQASPADILSITLNAKNTSPTLIRDGVLRLVFQTPSTKRQSLLNWTKLHDEADGDLRGEQVSATIRQATLTWTKKHISRLGEFAPGEEISTSLSIPIKDASLFDLSTVKERTIVITGSLTFTDASNTIQTITLPRRLITLSSDLFFEQRLSTTTSETAQETYASTWLLSHSFGSLKNIKASAEVFPNVVFKETAPPSAGLATYDPATKRLSWTISDMPESVDVLSWSFTLDLPTKNPSQNTLISKITIEAEDERGNIILREVSPTPL
jgi:hypothetical protein